MKHLLYKEFCLAIHPLFFLVLLCGALLLIPQWVFFVALMYILFIAVPNIFSAAKTNNDLVFSVMLPVRKRDVVKARIIAIAILEVLQLLVAGVFAFLNMLIYGGGNFVLDPNFAFFGFGFMMYAIHNVLFFPMFYMSGYRIGFPAIAGTGAAVLFSFAVELAVLNVPALRVLDGMGNIGAQLWVLAGGIAVFVLLNIAAYRISARRFERIDL